MIGSAQNVWIKNWDLSVHSHWEHETLTTVTKDAQE